MKRQEDKLDSVIKLKQLPIIEEQFIQLSQQIEEDVAYALSLDVTEESLQEAKKTRASIRKDFQKLERKRIDIRKDILEPYEKFLELYKKHVSSDYKKADSKLKERIDEVENAQIKEKQKEVEEYFYEYLESKNIDFISFEQADINVIKSASMKSLKDKCKEFIDGVDNDLKLIDTQEHKEEILVEYKKTLDASSSIRQVVDRHEQIKKQKEQEIIRQKEEELRKEKELERHKQMEQKAKEREAQKQQEAKKPKQEVVVEETAVKEDEPEEVEEEIEEIQKLTISVYGTINELVKLKEFLENNNYKYE